MKRIIIRSLAVVISLLITVSTLCTVLPVVFAANVKDSVNPILPFNASSTGGIMAEVTTSNRVFSKIYNSVVNFSSSTIKNGIIADLDALKNNITGKYNVVTPLTGGSLGAVGTAVNAQLSATNKLTTEKGVSVTPISGVYEHKGNLATSTSYASIQYSRKNSLSGADGILFYLKIDGANLVNVEIDVADPENDSRWEYSWDPWLMLKLDAEYSYMSIKGNSWKTSKAVKREGSTIFGAMKFKSAFEGWVKIPFSSLVNDCGFVFDAKQDYFEKIYIRTQGIGGKYGNLKSGPFFVLNKDSSSAKITVNTKIPAEAPQAVGGTVKGFQQALADVDAVLLYVKTDSANRISIKANVSDNFISDMPDLQMIVGKEAYTLKRGASAWKKAKIISTETAPAIELNDAFEGYIKIPITSFTESDASIAVLNEIDFVTGIEIGLGGIGGKFGKVITAPYFMTKDSGATQFQISDSFAKPQTTQVEVVTVDGATLSQSNWETVTHTSVVPLNFTSAQGSSMVSYSGSEYSVSDGALNGSKAYAAYSLGGVEIDDYKGLIVYLKLDAGNTFMPQIELSKPADTSRWNYDWNPFMMLAANADYQYLPINETAWKTGTTVAGVSGSSTFGAITFEDSFEGYIKIPFSALTTDVEFEMSVTEDKINSLYYRLKGIGGKYGKAVIGPTFYIVNDGEEGLKLLTSPIKATPITNWSNSTAMYATADTSIVQPLAWTNANGIKITPSATYESTGYEAVNINSSQAFVYALMNEDFTTGDATDLLVYVNFDKANAILPTLEIDLGWPYNPAFTIANKPYCYSAIGDTEWKNGTADSTGAISFNSAFEGYIKLGISDLVGEVPFTNTRKVSEIRCRLKGLGGEYGNAVIGPFFLVTDDSDLTEIKVPDEFSTKPTPKPEPTPTPPADDLQESVATRIKNVLKYSKDGTQQGYYFMVGDDTRYTLGFPTYRLVAHELIDKYNMSCILHSDKGMTAEYWSGAVTDKESSSPTVDDLIKAMPNDGKGCIVDISLGLNDSSKSAKEITGYIQKGIEKLRKARPYAVIVYTSPNITMTDSVNSVLKKTSKSVWADKNIFAIDVQNEVFNEFYTQFFIDSQIPNVEGYRNIAKYIISKYTGTDYKKLKTTDSSTLNLPDGATLIDTDINVARFVNTAQAEAVMKINGKFVTGLAISGTAVSTGTTPFNATNQTVLSLAKGISGSSYVAFRLILPAANKIGLSAIIDDGSEIIFMKGQKFEVLPDGATKWKEYTASAGREDGIKTYGALEFSDSFTGWIRLPLSGFYNSPSTEAKINNIRLMFSEMGGNYGSVQIGPFISMTIPPYEASNVWKKSDLPEMVPFTDITGINKYWEVSTEVVPSPIPTLSSHKGVWFGCDPVVDKTGIDYMQSWFWAEMQYDDMPIGNFTHLMFYVKVSETKENHLSICMFTETDFEFKVMAKMPYQLLSLGSNEWQHYNAEDVGLHNYGGIILPAGFEGFIKLPLSSLLPANEVKDNTKLARIAYRFSYFGMEDERAFVGPVFGVTKDNDPGPDEVVYDSLPSPTTVKRIYTIENSDIFTDKIMVYWQPLESAYSYLIEAYSITKTENGLEYRLVSTCNAFTNSGTVGGLEMGTMYAILVKGLDDKGNAIAIYEYTRATTVNENPYPFPLMSEDITYDTVYFPNQAGLGINWVMPAIIALSVLVVAAGIIVTVIVLKKRRKKTNE